MTKVLLFQCEREKEIRQILTPMKIRVVSVPKEQFGLTLGEIEKGQGKDCQICELMVDDQISEDSSVFEESLLVMCNFTESQMNRLLMELRKKQIRIGFKAILTPTNYNWNVKQMYTEMARERAMYMKK